MRNVHNQKSWRKKKKVYIKMPHIGRAAFSRAQLLSGCVNYVQWMFHPLPSPMLRQGKKNLCSHTPAVGGERTHTYTLVDVISRPLIKRKKKEDSI